MIDSGQTTITRGPGRARRGNFGEIVDLVSATIGTEFFESLVRNVGPALSADCVYIGEFVGGQSERVKTLASFAKDGGSCSSDYSLAGTAAAQVATGEPWSCTRGVLKRFPDDHLLTESGAQACVAVPLLNTTQQALGVMLATFRNPLSNTRMAKSLLEMFAPRAASELQRKQSDAAMRESEERYHAFISQNSDAMWRIEFERPISTSLSEDQQIESIYNLGYLAECNDALARFLGYEKAEQLIGASFESLARHADSHLRDDIRAAIRSGYRFDSVERMPQARDGKIRHMLRSQWCIVENGQLQRVWGTLRDITELKRVEKALEISEKRLSELIDSLHLLTVMLDADGSIAHCNNYFLRLTGWEPGEIAGKNWFDLMVPPEEREKLRAEFASTGSNSRSPRHLESTLVGKDGRRWLIAWESSLLRDADGKITGSAGVGHDITVHRAVQEASSQSRKLESMRRFVNQLGNDFSNLLTVISGHSAILLHDSKDTDPTYSSLTKIRAAADEAARLAEQLSSFSQQRTANQQFLDLNRVMEDVRKTVEAGLPSNVTLHMELDPSLGIVNADASQFREVLLSLAVNSIEAMPEGGYLTMSSSNIEVDEELASEMPGIAPGRYVLLSIADTGGGMSEDVRSHLFEPFFTTKTSRSGLGLSSVYGIVRQNGGHILVDTAPDVGTSFQIYLPRVKSD